MGTYSIHEKNRLKSKQEPSVWPLFDTFLLQKPSYVRPKVCCFFKNLAINYFPFTALYSADKFSSEQQTSGLKFHVNSVFAVTHLSSLEISTPTVWMGLSMLVLITEAKFFRMSFMAPQPTLMYLPQKGSHKVLLYRISSKICCLFENLSTERRA